MSSHLNLSRAILLVVSSHHPEPVYPALHFHGALAPVRVSRKLVTNWTHRCVFGHSRTLLANLRGRYSGWIDYILFDHGHAIVSTVAHPGDRKDAHNVQSPHTHGPDEGDSGNGDDSNSGCTRVTAPAFNTDTLVESASDPGLDTSPASALPLCGLQCLDSSLLYHPSGPIPDERWPR